MKDFTNPKDQALRDGRGVASGTTGLYAPANQNPESFKNPFVSGLRKNPDAPKFYDKNVFSSSSAQQSQSFIDSLNDEPKFTTPGDQSLAKDFLAKYSEGVARGLVPQEESVSRDTIAGIQSEQPAQGLRRNSVTIADKLKVPGAGGVQTT